MKSKRNFEVMKEVLCKKFEEYIFSLGEDDLYNFLMEVDSTDILVHLSENCKPIEYPQEVLRCEQCRDLYGDCESEMERAKNPFAVCKKRFYSYCDTPVAKQ